jgi:hypothetical protein
MNMNSANTTYITKDFYISCCLLASGLQLLQLDKSNGKDFVYFVFQDLEQEAIVSDHWSRNLIIPTKDLVNAIQELKTRLYSKV